LNLENFLEFSNSKESYMILKLLPNNSDGTFFIFKVKKPISRSANPRGTILTVYCSNDRELCLSP
jgi:hypothetical protein